METQLLSYGDALHQAQYQGAKIARIGWNGKGMFVYYHEGTVLTDPAQVKPMQLKDLPLPLTILPRLDMKSATGEIVVGWLASQTDMLANDWQVVG